MPVSVKPIRIPLIHSLPRDHQTSVAVENREAAWRSGDGVLDHHRPPPHEMTIVGLDYGVRAQMGVSEVLGGHIMARPRSRILTGVGSHTPKN